MTNNIEIFHFVSLEMDNKIRVIINTVKYLKKLIKRLPKDSISDEDNRKLFVIYEELVDLIVDQIRMVD